ncbi:hypothetical protein EVAR_9592_1 [Eumeta japonica]|uniref:Uncharacterized protein n=1 Tax=Eumeta variegata TaxID=151549 RepID=A0A4C1TKV5_EUMVA|nr:hypothetical protein EVAR_9592_1 [Eumeta japonica]
MARLLRSQSSEHFIYGTRSGEVSITLPRKVLETFKTVRPAGRMPLRRRATSDYGLRRSATSDRRPDSVRFYKKFTSEEEMFTATTFDVYGCMA